MNTLRLTSTTLLLPFALACGSSPPVLTPTTAEPAVVVEAPPVATVREQPPVSQAPRDIHFPPIARTTTGSGLELNTVELRQLPLVQIELVIRSGSASDPANLPGLAQLVSAMLKEGTKKYDSAKLAEAIEYLGADLSVSNDEENVTIRMRALSEHAEQALSIVAEVAMRPTFSDAELKKLKKRELDRLALAANDPNSLVAREFYKALYGDHPYARIDTTAEAVKRVTRSDLQKWHKANFAPNNAFMVVAGDISAERVSQLAETAFKGWASRTVVEPTYAAPPTREGRQIVLVDRPASVQSVVFIGNLALDRKNPDYVPLMVANQVLGGSAAARLFMDLRERRSLTYGAYSRVYEGEQVAPFRANSAVRNEVTAEVMAGFFEHLQRIVTEPAAADEIEAGKRYLVDRFPLDIDTAAKIAHRVANLRIFGLPDNYWDGYRQQIAQVTPEAARQAAKRYITPDKAVIVVVGRAADVKPALEQYGQITVIDIQGNVIPQSSAPTEAPVAAEPSTTTKE